ncbi:uncharacterized protein [Apostichopus japonicus]|uniref:uncharacterized protein isoform X4 n=1 Tax=Stichopus japonicus TaxID=307972 RepID=UPI003AB2961B
MHPKGILSSFIYTLCTVNVILSSNVTDITNTIGTEAIVTALGPTDELTTAVNTLANNSRTTVVVTLNQTDAATATVGSNISQTSQLTTALPSTDGTITTVTEATNTSTISNTITKTSTNTNEDTTEAATSVLPTSLPQTTEKSSTTITSSEALSTLNPTTTIVPTTEAPLNLECDDVSPCLEDDRCLKRQAPTGPDYVCECKEERGNTYGFDCQYTYNLDFRASLPLRTCYGPECATGSVSSMNYPMPYRNRDSMMTLVYVPGAYRFDLSFDKTAFGIEYFKDDLLVGGGLRPPFDLVPGQPDEKEALTGANYFNGFDIPDDFTIINDTMWIWFATDPSITFDGFKLTWTSTAIDVDCPDGITIDVPDNSDRITDGWNSPTIIGAGVGIDNLDIDSNYKPEDTFEIGTYDVTYRYKDAFRNTAECNFRLNVRDVTRPVVEDCPDDIELETCDGRNFTWMEPIAFDNSNKLVVEEMIINRGDDELNVGRNIIVYTFEDASQNRQECRFEVNIICPSDKNGGDLGIELWIILAGAAAAVAILLLILAFFAHAKLAAMKAANQADLSFNPEEYQGHKPGAPLEEEILTNGKGKDEITMYDFNGGSV